jgi:hypothetical protein
MSVLSVEPRLFFLSDDLYIKFILAISWRILQVTSSTCGWLPSTTHVSRMSCKTIVIWLPAKHTVNRLDSPRWNLHIFVQPLSSLIHLDIINYYLLSNVYNLIDFKNIRLHQLFQLFFQPSTEWPRMNRTFMF